MARSATPSRENDPSRHADRGNQHHAKRKATQTLFRPNENVGDCAVTAAAFSALGSTPVCLVVILTHTRLMAVPVVHEVARDAQGPAGAALPPTGLEARFGTPDPHCRRLVDPGHSSPHLMALACGAMRSGGSGNFNLCRAHPRDLRPSRRANALPARSCARRGALADGSTTPTWGTRARARSRPRGRVHPFALGAIPA